jgi:hypothetical protein
MTMSRLERVFELALLVRLFCGLMSEMPISRQPTFGYSVNAGTP